MIDSSLLNKLSNHKDPDVKNLVIQVNSMMENHHYESYISLSIQLKNWINQYKKNKIDLFNSEQKPIFEMAYKFYSELKPLLELQDYLKAKLSPEAILEAKKATSALEQVLQESGEFIN